MVPSLFKNFPVISTLPFNIAFERLSKDNVPEFYPIKEDLKVDLFVAELQ
jgi:hypothetical protein